MGSHLILKLHNLLLMNSGYFPSQGVFRWSDSRQYLLPLTCRVSTENSYCRTPSAILSGADRQPTLDTVGTDEMRLHGRSSCGWATCISLPASLSLLLLGGGIFEHLYFWSTDLQNSNATVQKDFLAIEQKFLISPPQPTSPTYCKINIRQWACQIARKMEKNFNRHPPEYNLGQE